MNPAAVVFIFAVVLILVLSLIAWIVLEDLPNLQKPYK